ncbi:MAG: hypothetical protein KF678_09945 [Phycisphaeraceae bacterium]|nr:hypothetical protein [Phycisphaeraceae bacterium]
MRLRGAYVLGVLGLPLAAHAETIFYSNNFESGLGTGWGTAAQVTQHTNFSKFVGRYSGNQGVLLTVAKPSVPTPPAGSWVEYRLTFDFYAIDSWDGDDPTYGPDYFCVSVNSNTVFAQTFANQHQYQSFMPPTVGGIDLGYGAAFDSIYRDITVTFNPGTASNISVSWYGIGLQGIADESWGIDNVRLSYAVVPSPAAGSALALAGLAMLRRRRH